MHYDRFISQYNSYTQCKRHIKGYNDNNIVFTTNI